MEDCLVYVQLILSSDLHVLQDSSGPSEGEPPLFLPFPVSMMELLLIDTFLDYGTNLLVCAL